MLTVLQMMKDAKNLYAKYFPDDESRNIRYGADVSQVCEFIEEVSRFLKKYSETPINATLEALK